MPCWPDVWEHLKQELPIIEVYAVLAAYLGFVGLLLWAPKLGKRWAKITSRVLGLIGLLPLPALLFGFMLASGNPPTKSRMAKSTNGAQATLNYNAGFLGRDFTEVTLKQNDCCRHYQIFWHSGPSSFEDAQLKWIDEKHLQITYHSRFSDPSHCDQVSGDIVISCVPLQWPEIPASNIPREHLDNNSKE